MILTFFVPSMKHPVGGATLLYEYANAMSRRGHDVGIVHGWYGGWTGARIDDLDDLRWFAFEPGVRHEIARETPPAALPDADVIFGFGRGGPRAGLPVAFVQGFEMFDAAFEDRVFRRPWPKVCVARWLVEVGLGKGVPASQLWYVPNGIDHTRYRVVTPLEARPLQVSMLCSAHHQKGTDIGLEALATLVRRVPGTRVRLFGTSELSGTLPPGVEFAQSPPQRVLVEEIYNGSRVFVCPSRVEGFGLTSVEAMACGCALVTTDNGGSRDYAVHGDTALVSPPGDPATLAANVETLLLDDDRRISIARRGERAAAAFDWDASAAELEGFLTAYVADPGRYRS